MNHQPEGRLVPRFTRWLTHWVLVWVALLTSSRVWAEGVLILHPEIREPYARIYIDTLAGIRQIYRGDSKILPVLPARPLSADLFGEEGPNVAVALGNSVTRALIPLNPQIPVITTGTIDAPFPMRRQLAYYPDPPMLLEQLRRFQPGVEGIKLVASSEIGGYLDHVSKVLADAGISLEVCPAEDLRNAAACYQQLLKHVSSGEALWILQGGRLLEPTLLSFILDVAWQRRLPIFSSNPDHVGRGALFALYPDNQAAGRQIGILIQECLRGCGNEPSRVSYLQEMKVVLNARTSRHLGLDITPEIRQGVDLVL